MIAPRLIRRERLVVLRQVGGCPPLPSPRQTTSHQLLRPAHGLRKEDSTSPLKGRKNLLLMTKLFADT